MMAGAEARAMTAGVVGGDLPTEDSLYYDYLVAFPIGQKMSMTLQPDGEALTDDEAAAFNFNIKKIGEDSWEGLGTAAVSTYDLFDYIKLKMEGETHILVTHGQDPRRIKKEIIMAADADDDFNLFSIFTTIDLTERDRKSVV